MSQQSWFTKTRKPKIRLKDRSKVHQWDWLSVYKKFSIGSDEVNVEMLSQYLLKKYNIYFLPADQTMLRRSSPRFRRGTQLHFVGKTLDGAWETGQITLGDTPGTSTYVPDAYFSLLRASEMHAGHNNQSLCNELCRDCCSYASYVLEILQRKHRLRHVDKFFVWGDGGSINVAKNSNDWRELSYTIDKKSNSISLDGYYTIFIGSVKQQQQQQAVKNQGSWRQKLSTMLVGSEQEPVVQHSVLNNQYDEPSMGELNRIKHEYGSYLADVLTPVTVPLLLDGGCEQTSMFLNQLAAVEALQANLGTVESVQAYNASVDRLTLLWDGCLSNARLHGTTSYSYSEKRKFVKAHKLIIKAQGSTNVEEQQALPAR